MLWAIVVAVDAVYTTLSIARYLTGNPASYDLGIFTEAVQQYAHLRAPVVPIKGMDLLGDHFSPIVAVLAPLFRLFPSAVTLLVAQAGLAAVSIVPVYQAAAHLLERRGEARLIAAAYGLSWGLAQMVWYDFHEVCFAVPLFAWSVSAMVRGRHRAAVWWAIPLVLVKEDQGWTVLALGLILALFYRRRLAGALLAVWGVGWALLATYVLIPAVNPQHVYPYWKDSPHHIGMLFSGWETKSTLIALLILPTAGLALRSPLALAAVPALALRLASSDSGYWGTAWHYSATAMPILAVAAVDGLSRLRAAGQRSWAPGPAPWFSTHGSALMVAIAAAMVFQTPIAQLWQPGTYRTPRHIEIASRAERMIPSGQTVAATIGQLAPLGARDQVCVWKCATAPQWLLLDQAKGEWWQWMVAPTAMTGPYPDARYRTVFHSDGVWLLKRVG